MIFLKHYYNETIMHQGRAYVNDAVDLNEASKKIDNIFAQKSKIIIFLFVPLAAFTSFIIFKRKKLNLSEHAIVAGMILLGILLLSIFGNLIFYIDILLPFSDRLSYFVGIFITSIIFLYIVYAYFNAFGNNYTKLGFAYRILLFFSIIFTEVLLLFIVAIGVITNWEFGEITISPF